MANDYPLPGEPGDPLADEMVNGFAQPRRAAQRRPPNPVGDPLLPPPTASVGPVDRAPLGPPAAQPSTEAAFLPWVTQTYGDGGNAYDDRSGLANQYRPNLQVIADAWNTKSGSQKAHAVGDDRIDFGDGRGPIDVITSAGNWWYDEGNNAPSGGGGGGGGGVSAAPGSPYSSQISDQIMKLLAKGNTPVTEADVAAQYEPVSRTYQRGAQRARETAAERMAYSGLNSGGSGGPLDAEVNSINESLAEKQAGTMGNLMQQELTARRQDVVNALNFAQGEEKTALQLQLAQIDKELRQQGMGLQNQQFYDKLGFDMSSHADTLDTLLASYLNGG